MESLREAFDFKGRNTSFTNEIQAGLTTFFAMSYIVVVNPAVLSQAGIPYGAVYVATILSSVICTLLVAVSANVPYVLAPGLSLNSFFAYTVVIQMGFTWQEALAMVFLCGVLNVITTLTKVRSILIQAVPAYLQDAIAVGIGAFIFTAGIRNVFAGGSQLSFPEILLFLIGIVICYLCLRFDLKGGVLLGMMLVTLLAVVFGIDSFEDYQVSSFLPSFREFRNVFLKGVWEGLCTLPSRSPLSVISTVLAFSLSDTFDTLGTFIGTGTKTGIFSEDDKKILRTSRGMGSGLDRALLADAAATPIGALLGTSNVTTYVESSAGISAGGRTGLTGIVAAVLMFMTILFAPLSESIPMAAISSVLVVIGIMMMRPVLKIDHRDLTELIPTAAVVGGMACFFSISYGLALGFLAHCIVHSFGKKKERISPVLWACCLFFAGNFILMRFGVR